MIGVFGHFENPILPALVESWPLLFLGYYCLLPLVDSGGLLLMPDSLASTMIRSLEPPSGIGFMIMPNLLMILLLGLFEVDLHHMACRQMPLHLCFRLGWCLSA